ncbi:protein-ribulosamine 3-kinase, chloroplastic isoform X5 [Brachypodium distachyon]|uniref:protein-ribulosamine 3-kinase, chloroplastic isoform X5 n=1 Tax=Brachypodium distachyon TaxID=15368 RepID=UPI000D0D7688|nr:protein-ribulosamine 3-kinase, chloroplastic isoform X5 [Brachypodium distachyon]|eukprot:XP_024312321.1 protein-ribulosamine 3-kinase, chloroplastic isoform X5 [Brachypodium distachyon]
MANVALLSASSSPSTSSSANASSLVPRCPPSRRSACTRRAASKLSIVAAMGDDPIKEWILTEGKATQITGISSIGGGCINSAQRYITDAGSFFVKTNRRIGPAMFEGEALGLKAMYDTKSIRVPLPYKVGSLPTGGSFIIMEFIQFGRSRGDQLWEGSSLKCIKLLNLIRAMVSTLKILLEGQQLIKNMHPLFDGAVIEPCLLHGDLWSGNISSDANGDPVILDPACYYGHNEAEFGMSWCAGFGGEFYSSYFQVMPKQPGFEKRRDLYLLYHYLNHYNLFGSGYRSSAMSIIEDYLRMLKA